MYRKLMFLISLVCFLAVSLPVSALTVNWPDVYTVSGTETYGEIRCHGTIIVPAGATLVMNSRSRIDGNGDDGEGGTEYAAIIVDGGTFLLNDRLDMGTDNDAYLIVRNGGYVEHHGTKITIPDNDGGEHRLVIESGGEVVAEEIEVIVDRNSKIILGCDAIGITMGAQGDDESRDLLWLSENGGLECKDDCGIPTITDLGGNVAKASCLILGPKAWAPAPSDGATQVQSAVTTVELGWNAGTELGRGRHYLYFGTDADAVCNGTLASDEFMGALRDGPGGRTTFNVGNLPLWTTFYWNVDEFNGDGSLTEGDCWSFTTGCAPIAGDTNMDCLLNFLDYADIASTWQDEQFWPR
jgi:hypothetical protein